MTTLSLKIILDDGAVTRTIKFDPAMKVAHAYPIIKDKVFTVGDMQDYGLFLPSVDDNRSGTWLEPHRSLEHYMLREGDALLCLNKARNLRVKMLDGVVKTLQVDESKSIGDLLHVICGKVGIINHEEYGLCHEEMEQEEGKEARGAGATGTLTLKRRQAPRERDAKMEQLSKKLKTDDNVEWLDQHRTLREEGVDTTETLLLKRRLFYSDRNVDSRDPKQLNMLYNENKSAILYGKHPVTEEEAINFAAIQCQIDFGDFNEEKHKPGIIENMKGYLPEQYFNAWGAEKRILKLYRKHQGLSQLDAMHLYNKTARELPTYGVTFFLVKEKQKGKNKLISCLLGINANSILRLDVETKEILQEWPLTHVKTYHATKNNTFMFNFGDYSDKEYTVKTTDAHRIRDILEGYIDVIQRRMLGGLGGAHAEGGVIAHENVNPNRGNMITHVASSGPSKVVETSFVGPSRILAFEQGSEAKQGTQMMTVQQVIITNQGSKQQQVLSGEVPMRGDMSKNLVKGLNHLNSNAVKIVTFLTDPTPENMKAVRNVMETIEEEMPSIDAGVKDAAEQQQSADAKRKLLAELEELSRLCANMAKDAKRENMDPAKMDDDAKRIADLTTQIVFAVDPRSRRRSEFLRSFIQDERMDATLRRASFLAASDGATQAAGSAIEILDSEYNSPPLSNEELDRLEASVVDKMGKLNAAVALFLNAHSDPENIDYAAAVNSMNTIKEILPKLARDAKALSEAGDDKSRQELLDEVKALCNAARAVSSLTGCDDHGKLQQAVNDYSDVSGRLVYVFGSRNPRVNADKENELVELAQQAGAAATQLLVAAHAQAERAPSHPAAPAVDGAGVAAAHAAADLLAAAQVSAPTIHEAHCRGALSASIEAVSSRAKRLVQACQPLVVDDQAAAEDLSLKALRLAEALDRLKAAFADLDEVMEVEQETPAEAARLRFVAGVRTARDNVHAAERMLDEPIKPANLSEKQINELQDNVSQKMGQINAAVASLLQAKSDPQNPDYDKAQLALDTIARLMPEVIKDSKALISTCQDERARRGMLGDMRAWCEGVNNVCYMASSDDPNGLDEAANQYAQASKKLSFVFSPRARKAREQLMMELFDSAHRRALDVVEDSNQVASAVGGASGERLRGLGTAVEDSARALQTTLMVTGDTLSAAECRAQVSQDSCHLEQAASRLAEAAGAIQDDETGCRVLSERLHQQRALLATHAQDLANALRDIRETLDDTATVTQDCEESPVQASQRLKFITSASAARQRAREAESLLDQPTPKVKLNEKESSELEEKLTRDIAAADSAVATLICAKTDRQHPDYRAAEMALQLVSELIPGIVNKSRALGGAEGAGAAADLRAWCAAVRALCDHAHTEPVSDFVDSAQKYADTSNKLSFIISPRERPATEQKVLQLSARAGASAQAMAGEARAAAARCEAAAGAALRLRGRAVRVAAQALCTTAQLTAPSLQDPTSQRSLLATTDTLAATAQDLVSEAASRPEAHCQDLRTELGRHKQELDSALGGIRTTCAEQGAGKAADEPKRLKFVSTIKMAQNDLETAEKTLDRPTSVVKLSEQQAIDAQKRLSQQLSQINAAVASLIVAKSDTQNPNHIAAEESVCTITELTPTVIKDTKALSSNGTDEATKRATLQDTHDWCDALRGIYASAGQEDDKGLDKAAQKFIVASKKLQFTVGSQRNPAKEQEAVSVCGEACGIALQMSAAAGAAPRPPRAAAARLAAAARALHSAALLTAPTLDKRHCQDALLSSADALTAAAKSLVTEMQNSPDPGHKIVGEQLHMNEKQLEAIVQKLKESCSSKAVSEAQLKAQRLKFVSSANAAKNKAIEVKTLLDQPVTEAKLKEQEGKNTQEKLARAMAQINAALASLVNAKSDPQHPDYVAADKSLKTIEELMPDVVKDTRSLSTTCKDESSRRAMLAEMRAWCDAIHAVCDGAHSDDPKELNDSALKFSDASQKLRFVFSARKNPVKEQQITQLSSSACDKARQMADETQRVARGVEGPGAELMARRAGALREAASALHTTAQLTAPTIHEPQCREALVAAADALSESARALVADTARAPAPAARAGAEECARYRAVLEQALGQLRHVASADDTAAAAAGGKALRPPPVPVKKSSLTGSGDSRAPERVRVVSHSDTRRASQDWLDHMRRDASIDLQATSSPPPGLSQKDIVALAKLAEEGMKKRQQFETSLDNVEDKVLKAEQNLKQICSAKSNVPELEEEQRDIIQKQMEHKLALAGIAASKLISSNHPDEVDYTAATQSADTLSELVPDIVKDATLLSNTHDQKYKNALLDQIKALCAATRRLAGAARNNKEKLNESAIAFGEKSAGLLYVVSAEADPAQENGVISRAKAIGESAIRLADRGASLAEGAGGRAGGVCGAGRRAACAASHLVYTAKLVAPVVHHQQCQNSLISASHELSSHLKSFAAEWKPLSSDAKLSKCVGEMSSEADNLERLLESFRHDLAAGTLVKRKEDSVVEDTALRQLASQIMESAQSRTECVNLPDGQKKGWREYAGRLRAAITALDRATSRSKRAPLDLNRRRDLDNAVQNLLIDVLQARPSLEDKPQNNIVDLTDFVKDTNGEAEKLMSTASKTKVSKDKKELEVVKDECHQINLSALKILNPSDHQSADDTSLDDILEVDQFGQECEDRIQKMKTAIDNMKEKTPKDALRDNWLPLVESCSMLRFATKSALATTQSAALDETLEDLVKLEKQLDQIMQPVEGIEPVGEVSDEARWVAAGRVAEAGAALGRGAGGAAPRLPGALAAYCSALREPTCAPPRQLLLKEHARKLLELCKSLTAAAGTRAATWQPLAGPDLAAITQQVLQELDNPLITAESGSNEPQVSVLSEEDFKKLLMPIEVKIEENSKVAEEKLQLAASKLVSMAGTCVQGAHSPPALRRAAPPALAAAAALRRAAREHPHPASKPSLSRRSEEACQEMLWAVYGVVRGAERVCARPTAPAPRRRLREEHHRLLDAVNRVVRLSSPSSGSLGATCGEAARALHTRPAPSPAPLSAAPYAACLDALALHADMLEKLQSDEPMARAEFARALSYTTAAVCGSTECAAQCAYLLSVSEQNKEVAKVGLVDVARLQKLAASVLEPCLQIMRTSDIEQAKDAESRVSKQWAELSQAVKEAGAVSDASVKRDLTAAAFGADRAAKDLSDAVHSAQPSMDKITKCSITLVDRVGALNSIIERPSLVPAVENVSQETKAMVDDIMNNSKSLVSKTQALVKEVKGAAENEDPMTWVTFNTSRRALLQAFEALQRSLRENGQRAGIIEAPNAEESEEESDGEKSYLKLQEERARVWLEGGRLPRAGQDASRIIIDVASQVAEDMTGTEKEELQNTIRESEELLEQCVKKFDKKTARALVERIRELRKVAQRGVVTRVVEDFLLADAPLADLELLADSERDEARRKFLLEQKIAELMSQLGRARRTARLAARAAPPAAAARLTDTCAQTELLAPQLVRAAEERVSRPDDAGAVQRYRALLAQYAAALAQVRDLSDACVHPMDFVQAAGETMSRMREESSQHNNPQMCAYTSSAITRLAERAIAVSMSSCGARADPELRAALSAAQDKLSAAAPPPGARASTLPDWRDTTAEILRTTGEVESALGGENIFKKERDTDQPIYNAALNLHEAVREWSARDNEIVAVAKRMAVLMARLSEQMNTDRKRELIATSKSIVTESREVAALAKKLALECTDMRIRTNLLQVCERIPTISAQLKMLTSVKATSLANHGGEDDREGMTMIVGNAQNLMSSVQEVIKAAASASVKIASQRGLKWVRRNY